MSNPFTLADQAFALVARLSDPAIWSERVSRLHATAYRRYLRRVARLRASVKPRLVLAPRPYCCGTCVLWRSADGHAGHCTMSLTPATSGGGPTRVGDGCEQWEPHRGRSGYRTYQETP